MNTGQVIILSVLVPVLAALITAIVELRKTRVTTQHVQHQVTPNTGGSLRDAVDRAEAASRAIGAKLDQLSDQIHGVDRRLVRVEVRTDMIMPSGPVPRREDDARVQ